MSKELLVRSEDLQDKEVVTFYVDMPGDDEIIKQLKGRSPLILSGSRGVGKSILLRVAQRQMETDFQVERVMPVYLSFTKAALIKITNKSHFTSWMTAKICNEIIHAATGFGLSLPPGTAIGMIDGNLGGPVPKLAEVEAALEASWKDPDKQKRRNFDVPGPEDMKKAAEAFCQLAGIERIVLLIDEAAHVFVPEQQRQFFTLMRDLRSPRLSIKAAVYPGATAYGQSFQPAHDAMVKSIDRAVTDPDYCKTMKEIVLRQDYTLAKQIDSHQAEFEALAFAASGNPRQLLSTFTRSASLARKNVEEAIREYYRTEIWDTHSKLATRFSGHKRLIDWGRTFVLTAVLPELQAINNRTADKSSYIWIHRDAPAPVHAALQLLCYSGILTEGSSGISAGKLWNGVGTRYTVNLGCHYAMESDPIGYSTATSKSLRPKRMVPFPADHDAYKQIQTMSFDELDASNVALEARLRTSSDVLNLTKFQQSKLKELKLRSIGAVLAADEDVFRKAHGIGPVKARQMRNTAVAAVVEYLSG